MAQNVMGVQNVAEYGHLLHTDAKAISIHHYDAGFGHLLERSWKGTCARQHGAELYIYYKADGKPYMPSTLMQNVGAYYRAAGKRYRPRKMA